MEVDAENQTATVSAGALVGDVVKAADEKGFCVGESGTIVMNSPSKADGA